MKLTLTKRQAERFIEEKVEDALCSQHIQRGCPNVILVIEDEPNPTGAPITKSEVIEAQVVFKEPLASKPTASEDVSELAILEMLDNEFFDWNAWEEVAPATRVIAQRALPRIPASDLQRFFDLCDVTDWEKLKMYAETHGGKLPHYSDLTLTNV